MFNPTPANAAHQPVAPLDAAVVVLLRNPADLELYWVKRSHKLTFLGGFHAFPGGRVDELDATIPVSHLPVHPNAHGSAIYACAVRECFEETGILLAHGAERIPAERLRAWRQKLNSNACTFAELLAHEQLAIDARRLEPAPTWITPPTSPRRFDTRFFFAWLPADQTAEIHPGELAEGAWISPAAALQDWIDGQCLLVTPTLVTLKALAADATDAATRLHTLSPQTIDLWEQRVELRHGFYLCPLRTPTIPPATHTNCYFVGDEEMVIIDPGSPYAEEQARLDAVIDSFLAQGRRVREILITHLHPDHIGGVKHLQQKYQLPVATHRLTAQAIGNEFPVDRLIEDNDLIILANKQNQLSWRLRALWTPGHAQGHLSFHEERTGTLITGDCVVGFGTVVIAPPEGNMRDYFASLERYLALPKLTALLPGHGPVIADAVGKISEYIAHRQARETNILALLAEQTRSIPEIVATLYAEVPRSLHQLAELSVLAHLEKLAFEGKVERLGTTNQWQWLG